METRRSSRRSLRLRVVAEGVETAEQAQCLRELGAEAAQGYLYAPPLPAEEAERWWRARLTGEGERN
jgi:EAL domain-containing protein (putative c-di-GMP-specific phosphodiesterase class I)